MIQEEALKLIKQERIDQDLLWRNRIDHKEKELQYKFAAPHVLLLEQKLSKLRELWYKSASEELQSEFVKISALALRALEEAY